MKLENIDELKMLGKFRMYLKITQTPSKYVCDESGMSAPTLRTIMQDWKYIPSRNVRDEIDFFMDGKLTELKELVNS